MTQRRRPRRNLGQQVVLDESGVLDTVIRDNAEGAVVEQKLTGIPNADDPADGVCAVADEWLILRVVAGVLVGVVIVPVI